MYTDTKTTFPFTYKYCYEFLYKLLLVRSYVATYLLNRHVNYLFALENIYYMGNNINLLILLTLKSIKM